MNSVMLIGRLTRDPEVRYTSGSQMAVARFSIAIDRPARQGGERQTDFPTIVVFGRQAETCEKYLAKGRLVAIEGRIQTGRYQNRNGDTVYTTEVVANRVEFLGSKRDTEHKEPKEDMEEAFEQIEEDTPFQDGTQDHGGGSMRMITKDELTVANPTDFGRVGRTNLCKFQSHL